MPRVLLIHWNEEEARERATLLNQEGVSVAAIVSSGGDTMKTLKQSPGIDAFVISLERMPSHGREVGKFLREVKSTRYLPLIYIESPSEEKTALVRDVLPDAIFTSWAGLGKVLKTLSPVVDPIVPGLNVASDKPLQNKLGMVANMRVGLAGAPDEFEELLGDLPQGLRFIDRGKADLWFWFVRSAEELHTEMGYMGLRSPLWICWMKGTSVKLPMIRRAANEMGLVDYKVCSISDTWSGMIFKLKSQ